MDSKDWGSHRFRPRNLPGARQVGADLKGTVVSKWHFKGKIEKSGRVAPILHSNEEGSQILGSLGGSQVPGRWARFREAAGAKVGGVKKRL